MIDVSDGLAADLGHILDASGVGAEIRLAHLPLGDEVRAQVSASADWEMPLASGDDYELCFCIPEQRSAHVAALAEQIGLGVRGVGRTLEETGLRCLLEDGSTWLPRTTGFDHFSDGY
jgi:thiamine-monophosphate kinase